MNGIISGNTIMWVVGIEFPPSTAGAAFMIFASNHFLSSLDHLILPDGQHRLTFKGPSGLCVCDFSLLVTSTWMEKYSPEAEGGSVNTCFVHKLAGFPLLSEFPSYYQGSKVTSG